MDAKEAAGRRAAEMVREGMVVGLGTGSTATKAIEALGERVGQGLRITTVSSSRASEELARQLGMTVLSFADVQQIDVTIDGADEFDHQLRLIKGGGGALVREKLVAAASREMIVVADPSKWVPVLGRFPLPVAVFPFAWQTTLARLDAYAPDAVLRREKGRPYVTDDGLHIVDLYCEEIDDPEALYTALRTEVGVADVGLFLGFATRVIVGHPDGTTEEITRPA